MPFQSKENTLADVKRALLKGHFHSYAENGRGPDPQDPIGCVPEKSTLLRTGIIKCKSSNGSFDQYTPGVHQLQR